MHDFYARSKMWKIYLVDLVYDLKNNCDQEY